jgi:hypothetical protein
LSALRRSFKLGAQTNPPRIENVPFFPHLKEASARRGFFEREEFEAVLAKLPHYLKAPVTVAFITGWRTPSEVLTRQKHHLNLGAGILRLEPNESKTGEPREFPIDAVPELREIIADQVEKTRQLEVKEGRMIPWLFHHNGKPIRDYYRAWHAACTAAKLAGENPPRLPPHCRPQSHPGGRTDHHREASDWSQDRRGVRALLHRRQGHDARGRRETVDYPPG